MSAQEIIDLDNVTLPITPQTDWYIPLQKDPTLTKKVSIENFLNELGGPFLPSDGSGAMTGAVVLENSGPTIDPNKGALWSDVSGNVLINAQTSFGIRFQGVAQYSFSDAALSLSGKNLQNVPFISDASGNMLLGFNAVTSAVNYVTITNSILANGAIIGTDGSNTNVDLILEPKGTGNVLVDSNLDVARSVIFGPGTGSPLNTVAYMRLFGETNPYQFHLNIPNHPAPNDSSQFHLDINGTLRWLVNSTGFFFQDFPLMSVDSIKRTNGNLILDFDVTNIDGNGDAFNGITIRSSGMLKFPNSPEITSEESNPVDLTLRAGPLGGMIHNAQTIVTHGGISFLDDLGSLPTTGYYIIKNPAEDLEINVPAGMSIELRVAGGNQFAVSESQINAVNKKIRNILNPTASQDAVTVDYLNTIVGAYLKLTGNTSITPMTGDIYTNFSIIQNNAQGQQAADDGAILALAEGASIGWGMSSENATSFISVTDATFLFRHHDSNSTIEWKFSTGNDIANETAFMVRKVDNTAAFVEIISGSVGQPAVITLDGNNADIPLLIKSKGTGNIVFNDGFEKIQLLLETDFNSVSGTLAYLAIKNGKDGSQPRIKTMGDGQDINLLIEPKGRGQLQIQNGITLSKRSGTFSPTDVNLGYIFYRDLGAPTPDQLEINVEPLSLLALTFGGVTEYTFSETALNGGGNQAKGFADPTDATDLVTKGYGDANYGGGGGAFLPLAGNTELTPMTGSIFMGTQTLEWDLGSSNNAMISPSGDNLQFQNSAVGGKFLFSESIDAGGNEMFHLPSIAGQTGTTILGLVEIASANSWISISSGSAIQAPIIESMNGVGGNINLVLAAQDAGSIILGAPIQVDGQANFLEELIMHDALQTNRVEYATPVDNVAVLSGGNFFRLTNGNAIDAINTGGWQYGTMITFRTTAANTTFFHNETPGGIDNAPLIMYDGSDVSFNAGGCITFVYDTDGVTDVWAEVCRNKDYA